MSVSSRVKFTLWLTSALLRDRMENTEGRQRREKCWISTAGGAGEEHRRQEGSGASGSAAVPSALRGEGAKCVPWFPHLSDGDEDTSQNESGKHKGCSLFRGWSLSWDKGLGRIMLSHCGRKEGRELDRGESCGWWAIVHGCRLRSLPPPSSCLGDIIRLHRQQEEAQASGPLWGAGRGAEESDANEKNIWRSR